MFNMILAMDQYGRIGRGRNLLWNLPEDLAHFKNTTKGKVVIVGQETLKSIGMLLPGRKHLIIAKNLNDPAVLKMIERAGPTTQVLGFITEDENDIYCIAEKCAHFLEDLGYDCSDAWVIGGAKIYAAFSTYTSRFVITHVLLKPDADVLINDIYAPMFPALLNTEKVTITELLTKPRYDGIDPSSSVLTFKIIEYRLPA